MKPIKATRNTKAQVPLPTKGNAKAEFTLKNPPNLKPKNKRAK